MNQQGTLRVQSFAQRLTSAKGSADGAFLETGAAGLKTFTDVKTGDSFYLDVMEAATGHEYRASTAATETWTALK